MKRVAIFGATGYTGFELVRMLLSHKGARISVLTSEQYSEQPLGQAFAPFKGRLEGVAFGKMERLLGGNSRRRSLRSRTPCPPRSPGRSCPGASR